MQYVERLTVRYPKLKRFPLGVISKKSNPLTHKEISNLLRAKIVIEEMMDGKPIKAISSDPQLIIFAEDLKEMRETYYHIPGRYCIFDIFDPTRELFLSWNEKFELSMEIRKGMIRIADTDPLLFFPVPQIAHGKFERINELISFLGISAYAREFNNMTSSYGKGIVVKPGAETFSEIFHPGKILLNEFINETTKNNFLKKFIGHNPSGIQKDKILPYNNLIDSSLEVPDHLLSDQPIES
ncbi:MAG: hypothetical protein NTY68_05245 [Candidatus Micrarchaeota archaeon]|nr:hypothetical protein [Candidatus Micrarchaeota archaeon]